MNWGWPQIAYAALVCIGIGMALAKHGEPKNDTHSVWWSLVGNALTLWILYKGGFWN